MIKVLYLLNHAGKAGTERYVQTLIEKLNNKKIKAYFAYNENGLLVERLKALGVETFRIEMKNPFDIKAVRELSKLCKRLDIDLVHTQFLRENYIALLSRILNKKVKVMYTNHFVMENGPVLKITNRMVTSLESNIIAVCNKGKDVMISNGISGKKIHVIFNGVDLENWSKPVESTIRKEFGIGDNTFVFLCGSRFAHDKGHKFLINAVHQLKKISRKKFKCILSNDGPLLEECKKQVEDLGLGNDIIFTGFRKDMKNLIYGSDLYINSSEHEALSFAIIEVLACALPVIATDMAGNGDIINEKTNCGMLVDYNDDKGLAKAINKLMEDEKLRDEFGRNALKAVKEKFNLDKVAKETYNLYRESLKN
ncbi:glycosyltransferase [Herbivorax sp. ANBcel31]|uniref:glycosyltransferase n=1 Tax=Herbivorax sp. ANBcel31 TaxID=3069754 RepID=UPI0027B87BB1|nr:glycosyltransferase [Herbivorax sp. ANBcel31]MDQ2085620.1 glycosyltransferase [Herbivorax sp. ANBcel31]